MISTSVRNALQAVGRSVSVKELARQNDKTFPLSLRWWFAAPPPGRILRKVWSFDLLQRKFDEIINDPRPPLFRLRLHGDHYGASNLEIYRKDPVDPSQMEKVPFITRGLGHLEVDLPLLPNPDFYFNDLNTDQFRVQISPALPAPLIEAYVHFEVGGEELKINNFPNVDFDGLNARVKVEISGNNGVVDLLGWLDEIDAAVVAATISGGGSGFWFAEAKFRGKTYRTGGTLAEQAREYLRRRIGREFIIPDASVNASGLPDGTVASSIEGVIFGKVFDALTERSKESGRQEIRDTISKTVTTWLVGGPFHVLGVASDTQGVTIDFILPLDRLDPFPENPQPPLDPDLLRNIDHIVVLMMENRSFDHMLGYLRKHGGRADIDGLIGGEKNNYRGRDYVSFALPGTVFTPGPCHEHECVATQANGGKMDGFVADYAPRAIEHGVDPGQVIGYHTATHVPVYDALAREFLVCQRWFAAHPGPTFPNRFYTLTGRLNRDVYGRWQYNNPAGGDFTPVFTKTIFDHLSAQGVSWHYYEHAYCFLRLFERYTGDNAYIVDALDPVKGFFASAASGNLPSVSFIDPNFINLTDENDNDDQPPANITAGQNLIGRVVNAVVNGPLWQKTLLIVTYDEHGGFFDHVPPPAAIAVSGIDRYGVRVPALVVSPWVARGRAVDTVFDHTSILKTIARRFLSAHPPDMGERMAAANDLSMVLQPVLRQDRPAIPVPAAPPLNAMLAARTGPAALQDPNDWKDILRSVRLRYPIHRPASRAGNGAGG